MMIKPLGIRLVVSLYMFHRGQLSKHYKWSYSVSYFLSRTCVILISYISNDIFTPYPYIELVEEIIR